MKKNKKDRNYVIAAGIGIVLWTGGLVVFLALILNNPDQNPAIIYMLIGFIILGALLDFFAILHYVLEYFKQIALKSEKEAELLKDETVKVTDVHDLVDQLLKEDKTNKN